MLESADGSNDDDAGRLEAGGAALDVEELLSAEVSTEAGLGDDVVSHLHGRGGCLDGVAAMGDVGEGAAMHERRVVLERLDQVRLDGILEQRGAGTLGLDVGNGDRLAGAAVGDDDAAEAGLEVVKVGGQAEHCHDLGGDGDVEAVLAADAVTGGAEAVDHVAELTVVHVDAAAPNDVVEVDVELVALLDVVVEHSGEQVVGSTDGVEVAGEVQVDVLHGDDLGIAAARSATLDAKHGAQRRLTQAEHGALADLAQCIMQANRRGGLALASRRGVDGRHEDKLCLHGLILVGMDVDLGLVVTIGLARRPVDTSLLGYFLDRQHRCFLCDLDIGLRHF